MVLSGVSQERGTCQELTGELGTSWELDGRVRGRDGLTLGPHGGRVLVQSHLFAGSLARLPPRSQVLEELGLGCGKGRFSQPTTSIVITEMKKGSHSFLLLSHFRPSAGLSQ